MLLNEDFFKNTPDWEEVASKQVLDSDGFYTDYTWYKTNTPDGEKHIFIFGDKDIYEPDEGYADWISYTEQSAKEWFDNYNGFEDDEIKSIVKQWRDNKQTQTQENATKMNELTNQVGTL